ncbi:Ppx/GppA phosphatase family protein [Spirochaeta cellobiosiphila]|uniref:Ppx/GppA phosphatase family protein n=1 Tax=Spirochaeta cellobiosiphila TaxID=504483 RepID=UPI000404749F|nr:Ppx/GppA phosphatase family protein [Spirochaeta cellobiosiphila]
MKLDAVIHIGSSQFRLVIAEFFTDRGYRVIDSSEKMIPLGKDVFTGGFVQLRTMNMAIEILKHFKEQLKGWNVRPEDVKVIATSALREAKNRDAFLDRVEVRTGFRIKVVDGIEEIRLSYMAVQYALEGVQTKLSRTNAIIIGVGGGSTEVILLRRGKMAAVHSLSLGAVRVEQQILNDSGHLGENLENFLTQNMRPQLERLDSEMRLSSIRTIVAIGSYAKMISENLPKNEDERYQICSNDKFHKTSNHIFEGSSLREEGYKAAIGILKLFVLATTANEIIIPDVSVDEGVFVDVKGLADNTLRERYSRQIVASAISLGKKYNYDMAHARHVTKLGLSLFDQLTEEHGLKERSRLLLEVGSILHDIGTFVKSSGHHKHGMYLVLNSEIFGLNEIELKVVANLVRYHRKNPPQSNHTAYTSLNREHRLIVLKLASILRVADALDRGHAQRIRSIKVDRSHDRLIIHCDHQGDISVERFSLSAKAAMFEDVFGLKVLLR